MVENLRQGERFSSPYLEKIPDSEEHAIDIVNGWHQKGLRVIATDGVMDIPTIWHPEDLRATANLGDKLLLRIDSDELVGLYKDPRGSINPWRIRAMMAAHYPYVDLIVAKIDEEIDWLEKFKPDVIVISTTSYGGIAKDIEPMDPYLNQTGAQLVIFGENSNIVPRDQVQERAMKYEAEKFNGSHISGSAIKREIIRRALEDMQARPLGQRISSTENQSFPII